TVTEWGIGPVRAGMSISEASSVLGRKLVPAYDLFEGCDLVDLPSGPADVSLMVVNDTIARVDVYASSAVPTAAGARIGDSEARIRSLYPGRVHTEPHKYTDGSYLIVPAQADTLFRIVFETDEQGQVTRYRSGRFPAVEWVEGCA
ncbi:MAG: hypothetical protein M3P51_09400, partial [Chloroflexota bacterium]|nr:hypothetical protein [Chloroflexota bacterium]